MATLLEQLLASQGVAPPGSDPISELFRNNAFDSQMVIKSPAGGQVQQGQTPQPTTPGQPAGQTGPNPNTLGIINLASQLGRAILGGDNTALGSVAGVTGDFTRNLIFNQMLSQLANSNSGGSAIANPFNLAL